MNASLIVTPGDSVIESRTFFAPGARDPLKILQQEADVISGAHIGQEILDAIPDLAMILNDKRQIVAANEHCLKALGLHGIEDIFGRRVGEAVHCIHANQGPEGCGTGVSCRQCGAAKAILSCLSTQGPIQYECQITLQDGENLASMELLAKANYVKIGDFPLVLLVLRDISAEKRRAALEKLFFHDVMNSVGGMIGLAEIMVTADPKESNEYAHLIQHLAENVAEEINAHRSLSLAESGKLEINPVEIDIAELFREVIDGLAYHPISRGLKIEMDSPPHCTFRSDHVLLRRIVGNLVKNALEASAKGSVIKLSATQVGTGISIAVNNPGTIPQRIQSQLFNRSFTTKNEAGRGLGTYSIKLFTERYLHGHVSFTSCEDDGTTFTVFLPSIGETSREATEELTPLNM